MRRPCSRRLAARLPSHLTPVACFVAVAKRRKSQFPVRLTRTWQTTPPDLAIHWSRIDGGSPSSDLSHMQNKIDFIKDCIITIVSDDYESFEIILKNIKPLIDAKGMEASEAEVAAVLATVIVEGFVDAYTLSGQ